MSAMLAGPRRTGAMSLWRVEWLRLVRSPRGFALGAVYLFFGLAAPVFAKYLPDIAKHATGNGITLIVPKPTPKDGIANYVGQTSQTGLIVLVVVASGALALDSRLGVATFYRTRVESVSRLVAPRFALNAGAAVAANVLGTLAAWYGTALLLGGLPLGGLLAGVVCGSAYLVFAVAVVAFSGSLVRGTLGTVGTALTILTVLPILGLVDATHPWLPSTLVAAPTELLGTATIADFLRSLGVTVVVTYGLLVLTVRRLAAREL